MSLLLHGLELPPGGHALALTVRRSYRLRAGRRAEPTQVVRPLCRDAQYAPSANLGARRWLVADSDELAAAKPFTDVLLHGTARARGRTSFLDTGLQVGPARKYVRIWGDRRARAAGGGRVEISPPELLLEVPLTWDHAFGGRDTEAEALGNTAAGALRARLPEDLSRLAHLPDEAIPGSLSYPRNGAGRGYRVGGDAGRLDGMLLPSLEDPTDPITPERLVPRGHRAWIDAPVAACYGPIDLFTFPRAQHFLPPAADAPARPVHELASGALLPADLAAPSSWRVDPRMMNAAPAGLGSARLCGGERLTLWNLHASAQLFECELPADRPSLALELPGVGRRELEPRLQTVVIEPDDDLVSLTWSGTIRVLMPYPAPMLAAMPRTITWSR